MNTFDKTPIFNAAVILLALETSIRYPSISLVQPSGVTDSPGSEGLATANLVPRIARLLEESNLTPTDLDAVAVSIGPGSFTGLRLGVATAKTLAYAIDCKVFTVPTHLILARQARPESLTRIATVIDAQRGQWFAALHDVSTEGRISTLCESRIVQPQSFVDSLNEPTLVTGTGLNRKPAGLEPPTHVETAPQEQWTPLARTVGQMVTAEPERFQPVSPFELVPVYGRRSAAEEKHESVATPVREE